MTPQEKAALFPGTTPAERAEILMKAGRISVEAMPFVAAHTEAAIAEVRAQYKTAFAAFDQSQQVLWDQMKEVADAVRTARAHEREACAKVAEAKRPLFAPDSPDSVRAAYMACVSIAVAIRARECES